LAKYFELGDTAPTVLMDFSAATVKALFMIDRVKEIGLKDKLLVREPRRLK
jgi:hypothetical protein